MDAPTSNQTHTDGRPVCPRDEKSRRISAWARRAVASATIVGGGIFGLAHPGLAETTTPAKAPAPLYAYADGTAAGATTCPETTTVDSECPLQTALSLVEPGGSVFLATAGATSPYYGNFTVSTASTSATKPVTIEPASGVPNPILDGDASGAVTCPTSTCDSSVLMTGSSVFVGLDSLTIDDAFDSTGNGGGVDDGGTLTLSHVTITGTQANNGGAVYLEDDAMLTATDSNLSGDSTENGNGGAIDSGDQAGNTGAVTVTGSTFDNDYSYHDGGVIASGDHGGTGTLTVTDCTFSEDSDNYGDGGAIDSGDYSGIGTLEVTGSTFSDDSISIDGGAIDSGDHGATDTLSVTRSKFTDDSAPNDEGGGIDSGDNVGSAKLTVTGTTFTKNSGGEGGAIYANGGESAINVTVSDSTFTDNTSEDDGGAIDSGDDGDNTLTVSGSTFTSNSAFDGGAIDNSDSSGSATAQITHSTFSQDLAFHGGAIDSSDYEGNGTLTVSGSTFSQDSASDNGGAVDNGDDTGSGNFALTNCTFASDKATYDGGAVNNNGTGTGTVSKSTFSLDKSKDENGGAIDNGYGDDSDVSLTVNDSTFVGNSAGGDGGAIDSGDDGSTGTLTITFSTFDENESTGDGGAIDNGDNDGLGTASIVSSTLYDNGGYATLYNLSGSLAIAGSVVADSTTIDCAGRITDAGYNFENGKSASCGFTTSENDVVGGDPDLGTLARNGGDTETLKPTSASPLDAKIPNPTQVSILGTNFSLCPSTDQRGVDTPSDATACSIGSVDLFTT
jgi:predicted outer membrane repeat protein